MKKNILEEYRATKNKGEDFYIGYWLGNWIPLEK